MFKRVRWWWVELRLRLAVRFLEDYDLLEVIQNKEVLDGWKRKWNK